MARRTRPSSGSAAAQSSFWQSVTSDVGRTLITGVITTIGGYLAAALITPEQLYWYLHLRGTDSYIGQWYGEVGGRNAYLTITDQEPPAEGERSSYIRGTVKIGMVSVDVGGGADSAVTLTGELPDGRELNISLQRVQGAPGSAEEKMIRLLPQVPGQGARICAKLTNAADILTPSCTEIIGSTYFHL